MGALGMISGSVGIVLILFILYMMYRNRFNVATQKKVKSGRARLSGWMTNGAYVGYYTT